MVCEHKEVTEEPGEPTIGPYFICYECGRFWNSEGGWHFSARLARIENGRRKKPNPEGSGS